MPWLGQGCLRCGWPLTGPREVDLCGRCQRHPPVFAATTAALRYRPPADYLIRRLKFAGELALAPLLAELLAERLTRREAPLPECLLPVPLHRSRLRERGFNQATEIARRLGCRLGLPVNRSVCRRVRRTGAQSLLPVSARRKNVRDAFAVTGNPRLRHVALVDDVMTSGHTASELARMLARAGVATIEVWVVARAGR
jgi:ComF family protein